MKLPYKRARKAYRRSRVRQWKRLHPLSAAQQQLAGYMSASLRLAESLRPDVYPRSLSYSMRLMQLGWAKNTLGYLAQVRRLAKQTRSSPAAIVLRENRVGFDSPEYAARIQQVSKNVESLNSKNPCHPAFHRSAQQSTSRKTQ